MQEKSTVPQDKFKNYLEGLLGYRDQEKSMNMIAKVGIQKKTSGPFWMYSATDVKDTTSAKLRLTERRNNTNMSRKPTASGKMTE